MQKDGILWLRHVRNRSHMEDTFLHVSHGIHSTELPPKTTKIILPRTYSSGAELEAGEQQDLGQQHGKGQVGVDVVALVADGADRPGRRQEHMSGAVF